MIEQLGQQKDRLLELLLEGLYVLLTHCLVRRYTTWPALSKVLAAACVAWIIKARNRIHNRAGFMARGWTNHA